MTESFIQWERAPYITWLVTQVQFSSQAAYLIWTSTRRCNTPPARPLCTQSAPLSYTIGRVCTQLALSPVNKVLTSTSAPESDWGFTGCTDLALFSSTRIALFHWSSARFYLTSSECTSAGGSDILRFDGSVLSITIRTFWTMVPIEIRLRSLVQFHEVKRRLPDNHLDTRAPERGFPREGGIALARRSICWLKYSLSSKRSHRHHNLVLVGRMLSSFLMFSSRFRQRSAASSFTFWHTQSIACRPCWEETKSSVWPKRFSRFTAQEQEMRDTVVSWPRVPFWFSSGLNWKHWEFCGFGVGWVHNFSKRCARNKTTLLRAGGGGELPTGPSAWPKTTARVLFF